jgi:transcriptional regulator with XRE-family HTH domain
MNKGQEPTSIQPDSALQTEIFLDLIDVFLKSYRATTSSEIDMRRIHNMDNRFPDLLEDRQAVLGITDKELADLAEVDKSTVSRWKKGTLKPTKTDIQLKLQDILGVDIRVINEAVKGRYLSGPEREAMLIRAKFSPEAIALLCQQISQTSTSELEDIKGKLEAME